jgi:hypothetical protein
MINTQHIHAGDGSDRAPSLITVTGVCVSLATVITGIWIALGVLVLGH